jgi:hypothetical protein
MEKCERRNVLGCPRCLVPGSETLIGKTSGAGPVQPWKCLRCGATLWDKDLLPVATVKKSSTPREEKPNV